MKLFAIFLLFVLVQAEYDIAEPAPTAVLSSSFSTSATLPTISRTPMKTKESTSTSISEAVVTAPPEWNGVSAIKAKWHMTTYTTCFTLAGNIDCGVHEPVLPGGDEIAAAGRPTSTRSVIWAAVILIIGAFFR